MSTSISPLLQVTATQQPKSNTAGDGSGNDFHDLLSAASDTAKRATDDSREAPRASTSDKLHKDRPRDDAAAQSERQKSQSTTAVVDSNPSEEDQSQADDSLELSDAAAILRDLPPNEETVTFQAAATGPFEAEVLHVTAAEISPEAQTAPPLLSLENEGELSAAQQSEANSQVGSEEITELTTTLSAESLPSQLVTTSEVQETIQFEGSAQDDTGNQEQHTASQSEPEVVEGPATLAEGEQSEIDASQLTEESAVPIHTQKDPEPRNSAANSPIGAAESAATLQQSIDQSTQVEVATAATEAAPTPENSSSHLDSNAAKAPDAPAEARADASTPSATEAEPVPTADRYRFVQRVSRAFQSAKDGAGEIQLKLSPPELGTLKLSISVEQGVVSAKVETETAAARNILLDNLPALRERLAEQDIRVEKFDVDVGRDGEQSEQQSRFENGDRQHNGLTEQSSGNASEDTSALNSTAEESTASQAQVVTSDNLDVSI